MDISQLLAIPALGLILKILGLLVIAGQALIALTPSAADDALAAKLEALPLVGPLLRMLASFAPIQRK